MSKIGLMIDYEYCTGCQSCELACKNEHGFPLDKWGIKMVEFGPYEMEQGRMEWNYLPFPTSYCDLCEDRVNAVPYGTKMEAILPFSPIFAASSSSVPNSMAFARQWCTQLGFSPAATRSAHRSQSDVGTGT